MNYTLSIYPFDFIRYRYIVDSRIASHSICSAFHIPLAISSSTKPHQLKMCLICIILLCHWFHSEVQTYCYSSHFRNLFASVLYTWLLAAWHTTYHICIIRMWYVWECAYWVSVLFSFSSFFYKFTSNHHHHYIYDTETVLYSEQHHLVSILQAFVWLHGSRTCLHRDILFNIR